MSSDSAVNTAWLVFNLAGQWSLLGLLLTFIFVKHLLQRNNPFLINFLLTTYLGSIPPAILLYSGHQTAGSEPSHGLCFAQAALVDGVAPMFGVAQLALLFDTWSELRSLCLCRTRITRTSFIQYTLMFSPYLITWIWVFASFIAAAQSNATHDPGFAFCRNNSKPSNAIRKYVGLFMVIIVMIEIAFESSMGWIFYCFPKKTQKDPAEWRSFMHFALRLSALSFLQLVALILSVGNSVGIDNYRVKVTYELLTSMNALATFFTFATERSILQAWKLCKKPADKSQPPAYSSHWTNVQRQQPTNLFEEVFDHGNGQLTDAYFKPWLRVGQKS